VHLHYVRAMRHQHRLILHAYFGEDNILNFEDDEHAYMAHRRSIGNRGGRSGKVVQPSGEQNVATHWSSDFADPAFHITPWAARFRHYSIVPDQNSQLKLLPSGTHRDVHAVLTRPKHFQPTTATQLFNDRMTLRYDVCPQEWEQPDQGASRAPCDRKSVTPLLRLRDQLRYFITKSRGLGVQFIFRPLSQIPFRNEKQRKKWKHAVTPVAHLR